MKGHLTTRFVPAAILGVLVAIPCRATGPRFDYAAEKLQSLQAVEQEYGPRPVETIKRVLRTPAVKWKVWRRAVAALAFTGGEGATLLADHLNKLAQAGQYDDKTAALLYTLGCINDEHSVETALAVLESKGPSSMKLIAAEVMLKLAERTTFRGSPPVPPKPEGSRPVGLFIIFGSASTDAPVYSRGTQPTRESFLKANERLRKLLPKLQKKDKSVAKAVARASKAIEAKEQQLQKLIRKWEEEHPLEAAAP